MQARFNLIAADPLRMGDLVKYIEAEVFPAVESVPGSLGLSLYADQELGVAVLESFWASYAQLVQSEHLVSAARQEALRRATGTVSVERYRVPVFEREAPLSAAAALRLIRMDIEPSKVEDAVESYGDIVVSRLAETEGFCGALLLVHQTTGQAISEILWRNRGERAASRSLHAEVRVNMVASTDCVIRAVEEYDLIFNSARKPRS